MNVLEDITIAEVTFPLLAIVSLLALWQFHQNLVLTRRIYAIDFWDVSGIRMLLHATPRDGHACPSCRKADGTVFLPSLATKKNFSTLHSPCSNPEGCRCLIVALYGGWKEANHLVQVLRTQSRNRPMKLEREQFLQLFAGPWHRGDSAAADSLTIHLLHAFYLEGQDLAGAISLYRSIVEEARGARDLRLLVPAYLRLAELLERVDRPEEALEVIQRFEKRFHLRKSLFYYPSETQRGVMAGRASRLRSTHQRDLSHVGGYSPTMTSG